MTNRRCPIMEVSWLCVTCLYGAEYLFIFLFIIRINQQIDQSDVHWLLCFRQGLNEVGVVGSSQCVPWLINFCYMYFIFNSDLKHAWKIFPPSSVHVDVKWSACSWLILSHNINWLQYITTSTLTLSVDYLLVHWINHVLCTGWEPKLQVLHIHLCITIDVHVACL